MEKFYSKEALKKPKTAEGKERFAELARKEARRMYDRFLEKKVEEMEKEHRTLDDEEILGGLEGPMSDDELLGTPLSPDEQKLLEKKEDEKKKDNK